MVPSLTKEKGYGTGAEKIVPKEFTDIVGGHGRFQMTIFAFFLFACIPHCWHNLIMTFFAPNIDHWCARPPQIVQANISVEQWRNASLPLVRSRTGREEISHCTMYVTSVVNGSLSVDASRDPVKCSGWEYDTSVYQNTMVDEWKLVCDREWLVSMSKTLYMVAFLFAAITCGQLSDRFGRRKVVIVCLIEFLIASSLTLLSTNFIVFLVLRFFVAFGITSVYTVSCVIMSEIVSTEYRTIYGFTFKYGWTFGFLLLPYIAWNVPSWFWLQVIITLPCFGLLCVFWVVPETPRWLLTHGKHEELEKVLIRAARLNGKDEKQAKADIQMYITHNTQKEEDNSRTVFDLLRTPALRRNSINIYFSWFITAYIYFALTWNTNDLGGDPYWNFFLSGAIEFPSSVMTMVTCRYIGHRTGLLIASVLAGLCLIAMIFAPPGIVWLTITLSMSGKFFNSAAFEILQVYTTEIFPTVLRNVAFGSSSTFARIGVLIAPFVRQIADATHHSVPLLVPGCLSILSGLLMLLLPETLRKKLPDTLEEGEILARKQDIYHNSDKSKNIEKDVKVTKL